MVFVITHVTVPGVNVPCRQTTGPKSHSPFFKVLPAGHDGPGKTHSTALGLPPFEHVANTVVLVVHCLWASGPLIPYGHTPTVNRPLSSVDAPQTSSFPEHWQGPLISIVAPDDHLRIQEPLKSSCSISATQGHVCLHRSLSQVTVPRIGAVHYCISSYNVPQLVELERSCIACNYCKRFLMYLYIDTFHLSLIDPSRYG